MTIRDRKLLKQTAARRLEAASYKPRRLMLIHSGVALAASMVMAALNALITWQIRVNGGGLAGLELRTLLETVQTVLSWAYTILMPFWTIGMTYGALRLARGHAAWPHVLLEGFRRKGPVLRLVLVRGFIYGVLTVAAMIGSYVLYGMTPDGQAFNTAIMRLALEQGINDYAQLYAAIPVEVLEQVSRVYLPIFCVLLLALILPASYRMRLAPYVLMDQDGTGAWKAVRTSGKLTRHHGWQLVALDLSYWWYYLVALVLLLPGCATLIVDALQLQLPVEEEVIYLAGNLLYAVLTLAFETQVRPGVETTYALAYDTLLEQYQQAHPSRPEQTGRVVDSDGYTV